MSISFNINETYKNLKRRAPHFLVINAAIEESYNSLSPEQLEEITTSLEAAAIPIIAAVENSYTNHYHDPELAKQDMLNRNFSLANELYEYLKEKFPEIFDEYSSVGSPPDNE